MLIATGIITSSCASTLARNAVPAELADRVQIAEAPGVRHWGDAPLKDVAKIASVRREQVRETRPELLRKKHHVINMLAISGGGADGAYGAGLLNGWSAGGGRPSFEIVAGVSTGALSAPFAFLGAAYDDQLRELYTKYSTKDLIKPRVLAGLLGGTAVSDTKPLQSLIARYINKRVLKEIAREHRTGRRLLVGTTNLDSERPVVWDMGAIAARGTPEAARLFRRVLLASAALPGLFPPVFVKVQSDGRTFEEMHVDGGTTDNAFLLPTNFDLAKHERQRSRRTLRV
ncbi:MAG: patatin-like phospholipase family protein [Pseudomonadota bacterium]